MSSLFFFVFASSGGGNTLRELRSKKAPEVGERMVHGLRGGCLGFLSSFELLTAKTELTASATQKLQVLKSRIVVRRVCE